MQNIITKHYNTLPSLSKHERSHCATAGLRKYHNWIKTSLIQWYSHWRDVAFDICCGKGGDLLKWKYSGVRAVYMADIAQGSIDEAKQRNDAMDCPGCWFWVGDCFRQNIDLHLPSCVQFDIVSCHFSLHYAFDNETTLRGLLNNITCRLQFGGMFWCTFIDEDVIRNNYVQYTTKTSIFSLSVDQAIVNNRGFGRQCTFNLMQCVNEMPEYLVDKHLFLYIASEYGLQCIQLVSFQQWDKQVCDDTVMVKLKNMLRLPEMSAEEQLCSNLYLLAIFEKQM